MSQEKQNILVWLPSPMGDAILCTAALKAIHNYFSQDTICFCANKIVRQVLSPCRFTDAWLDQTSGNPLALAAEMRDRNFDYAILFKNSFMSAMTVFLARIPVRIGYARECRGMFLTDKLAPPRLADGKFKPTSMIDYYLSITEKLGAATADRLPDLELAPDDIHEIKHKLPQVFLPHTPIVILVPGGAFGPSKCWPAEYYAKTADYLVDKFKATVIVSVSPNAFEKHIAAKIVSVAKHRLINLAETPLTLGELKALFSFADLVITNDTGPRHIAVALQRNVISMFGPNNPAWTQTGYHAEKQIVADAPCVPCDQPSCRHDNLICMQSITVDTVCTAASKVLEKCQGLSQNV